MSVSGGKADVAGLADDVCYSVPSVTFRLLSGHSGHDEGILRGIAKVPGGFQGAPNIGIFRAAVKGDQPHAIWTLNLIAVLESISSL
jgi:hypothetical protein